MIGGLIELVWPRLEGDPSEYNSFLKENAKINSANLNTSIDLAKFMYEEQKDRVSTIESKSSIYLGFFGTVVAILAFVLKDILFLEEQSLQHDIVLLFGGVLVIYILKVMSFSIKALERKKYFSLDAADFLHCNKEKIVINLINKIKKNYDAINSKVEFMTMAHEFTKRIIWILYIAALTIIILSVYKYLPLVPKFSLELSPITFDLRWSDFVLFSTLVVVFLIGIRIRKIEKKIKKITTLF